MWYPRSDADTCADTHDTAYETTQTRIRYVQETALMRGQGAYQGHRDTVAIRGCEAGYAYRYGCGYVPARMLIPAPIRTIRCVRRLKHAIDTCKRQR